MLLAYFIISYGEASHLFCQNNFFSGRAFDLLELPTSFPRLVRFATIHLDVVNIRSFRTCIQTYQHPQILSPLFLPSSIDTEKTLSLFHPFPKPPWKKTIMEEEENQHGRKPPVPYKSPLFVLFERPSTCSFIHFPPFPKDSRL